MKSNVLRIAGLFFFMMMHLYLAAQSEEQKKSEEPKKGFNKEKLFSGGGLTVSISNYGTVLGATPVFGYRIAKWLDAGILFNFIYASQRHVTYIYSDNSIYYSDDKSKKMLYGPGAFLKIYPVNFIFLQAQGEMNFIRDKLIFASNTRYQTNGASSMINKYSAASFLVGGGYCQGREANGEMFYYVSLLFDIAKNFNSPYVEQLSDGSVNVLPIIRAGIQIPLFNK